jgi:exosome complex component RRP4
MAITILPPSYEDQLSVSSDEVSSGADSDVDMQDSQRPLKRPKLSNKSVVTPGEIITDDPQWMRSEKRTQFSIYTI